MFISCLATPHMYTLYFDPHLVHYTLCPFFLLLKPLFFPSSLLLISTSFVLFCIYTLSLVSSTYMSMVRENSPVSTALEKISSSLPCWNVERLDSVRVSAVNYSRGNFMSAIAMSHPKISSSSSLEMITASL